MCNVFTKRPVASRALLSLLLDKIAEVFQFDREVHIVDHDFLRYFQDQRRKVQNTGDAATDQLISYFLRHGRRHGDNCHLNFVLFDEARQLFHAQDRLCNLLLSPALRLDIERGDDFEPFLFEAAIREQCQTKMADTNEDHWLQPGGPELVGNPPRELTYIIPQTACAELAKI